MRGIYTIRQIGTSNCYIGSSKNVFDRWRLHEFALQRNKHHSIYLQRAWNKYGPAAFEFVLLEVCSEWSKAIAIAKEQYWIDKLKPVFNHAPIAGSPLGIKRSAETIAKVSAALKGRISPRKGVKLSEETKLRISKSKSGTKQPREAVIRRANAIRGQLRSAEQRANMSRARKGIPLSAQHKVALSEAKKAYFARLRTQQE